LACAFAAVIGHCYPVWYGFRGGKGAATAVGALAVIQPLALPPMLATWLAVLAITGWVGLSTMLAAISLVPALLWLEAPPAMVGFGGLLAAFIVFTHRSNIRNMLSGTEHRFERARARNWFR
jgi:glycerol-3-phosphate acyltransferase PlsY